MGHLVQPPCRSRVTYSRLHRTLSRQVLNISREGESTTSLGNLVQCSVILKVKKFFLMFSCNFTESQNHRMFEDGRDLCGSSSPTALPKQGLLQQAAHDLVQAGLEHLQRRRLSLPGQLCARCSLFCGWAPLNIVWPHPLDTHPEDICKHLKGPLSAFFSLG